MKVLSINEEQILYIDVELDDGSHKQYRTYMKPIGRIWEVLNVDNWEVVVDTEELENALGGDNTYHFHMWVSNRKIKMYGWVDTPIVPDETMEELLKRFSILFQKTNELYWR